MTVLLDRQSAPDTGVRSFLRCALQDMRCIGAVAPSSRHLTAAMIAPLECRRRPLSVLEAGAGTGAITAPLLAALSAGSRLVVVEPRPEFSAALQRICATRDDLDASVHVDVVQSLVATAGQFDAIVSALPFGNFDPPEVSGILASYERMLATGGTLTYFAYRGARLRRALTPVPECRARLRTLQAMLASMPDAVEHTTRTVWRNLPPAAVHTITMRGAAT